MNSKLLAVLESDRPRNYDLYTSILMQSFDRQLQNDIGQPQALPQAMLYIMETYSNPREWAAFVLVGQ